VRVGISDRGGEVAASEDGNGGGVPVIELCDELRRAARLAGVITREYKGEVSRIAGKTPVTDRSEVRETAEVAEAVTDDVTDSVGVTDSVTDRICEECGKHFVPLRKATARYCSGACRMRARRRR